MCVEVSFVLIGEGVSDEDLREPLELLCLECGAENVFGQVPDFSRLPNPPGRSVKEKVEFVVNNYGSVDLIFIHRDADNAGWKKRVEEIDVQAKGVEEGLKYVPVVPVRELEAWLLMDEQEIRNAVGNPNGKAELSLPKSSTEAERLADPKKKLKELLEAASEKTGRRLEKVKQNFAKHRSLITKNLSPDGNVRKCASWARLESDTKTTIGSL